MKQLQLFSTFFSVLFILVSCGGSSGGESTNNGGGNTNGLPSDINGLLVLNVEGSYGKNDFRGIHKVDFKNGQVTTHKFLTTKINGINPYAHDRNTITYAEPCGNDGYLHSLLKIINEKGISTSRILPCSSKILSGPGMFNVSKISPDKSKIAIEVDNGYNSANINIREFLVMIFDRNSGETLSSFRGYESPEWLPDGRLLMSSSAANTDNQGIYITSKDFTDITRIDQETVNQTVSFLNVNPVGNRLIFTMSGKIWMMNIDRNYALSDLQEVVSVAGANIQAPIWSPEGKYIAFISYAGAGRSWDAGRSDQIVTFWNTNSKKSYVFNLANAFPTWQQTQLWMGPGVYMSWVK